MRMKDRAGDGQRGGTCGCSGGLGRGDGIDAVDDGIGGGRGGGQGVVFGRGKGVDYGGGGGVRVEGIEEAAVGVEDC